KHNAAPTTWNKEWPNPKSNSDGIVRAKPIALVYIRPRTLICTHRSDSMPPKITPRKDAAAIVIVDSGPAVDIGISRFSAKRVGNQFLVAHPGRLGTAK